MVVSRTREARAHVAGDAAGNDGPAGSAADRELGSLLDEVAGICGLLLAPPGGLDPSSVSDLLARAEGAARRVTSIAIGGARGMSPNL